MLSIFAFLLSFLFSFLTSFPNIRRLLPQLLSLKLICCKFLIKPLRQVSYYYRAGFVLFYSIAVHHIIQSILMPLGYDSAVVNFRLLL